VRFPLFLRESKLTFSSLRRVESEVGKGSTFTVRLQRGHTHLPIEQVDHVPEDANVMPTFNSRNLAVVDEAASWRYDADVEEMLENLPMSSSSSSASNGADSDHGGNSSGSGSGDYLGSADVLSLKNRTIVLVDDSRDLRTYISGLLQKQFTVVQFGDPREALKYIQQHPPSLVLTDAMVRLFLAHDSLRAKTNVLLLLPLLPRCPTFPEWSSPLLFDAIPPLPSSPSSWFRRKQDLKRGQKRSKEDSTTTSLLEFGCTCSSG
jgi:hypothetical protein